MSDPAVLSQETNRRFWRTTRYKPGKKLDMSLAEDRAKSKDWLRINNEVKAEDAAGKLRITPDVPFTDDVTLTKETDARFWAQVGYKPNQKLDMTNAQDRAKSKKWLEINKQVRAEDAVGALVLTFNNPDVQRKIAEAAAHEANAASHAEAAAQTTDPNVKQAHVDAANQALDQSQQAGQAAASAQPKAEPAHEQPVPPPPPKTAPTADQIAHVKQTRTITAAVKAMLAREANARFIAQTHYPRQVLDPHNAQDRKWIPVWLDIYKKVEREYMNGTLKTTYDNPVVAQNLAEASAHDRETIAHMNTSAGDPAAIAAAAAAQAQASQKRDAAAAQQPQTADSGLVQQAVADSAGASTSQADQLANDQAATKAADGEGRGAGAGTIVKAGAAALVIGGLLTWGLYRWTKRDVASYREIEGIDRRNPVRSRPAVEKTIIVKPLPPPTAEQMAVR